MNDIVYSVSKIKALLEPVFKTYNIKKAIFSALTPKVLLCRKAILIYLLTAA